MYDLTLSAFPRFTGETDDAPRIRRAIDACPGGVLYIPRGIYDIASPLEIGNFCSLLMHKSACLRAVAEMEFLLTYDGGPQYQDLIVYDEDGEYFDDLNLFIKGGDLDGRGLASCLLIKGYNHITLADISLHNGKKYGLFTGGNHGYELIANNVYCKTTMSGLAGNIGICSTLCDSHFTDCIVVDYTTGMEMRGSSNRLTRCHVWGGIVPPIGVDQKAWAEVYKNRRLGTEGFRDQSKWAADNLPEMLIDSCCFRITGWCNVLSGCYGDTALTCFEISGGGTFLESCGCFNNFRFGMDGDLCIDHKQGDLYITGCDFRKSAPHSRLYQGSGEGLHVVNTRTVGEGYAFPEID